MSGAIQGSLFKDIVRSMAARRSKPCSGEMAGDLIEDILATDAGREKVTEAWMAASTPRPRIKKCSYCGRHFQIVNLGCDCVGCGAPLK